MNTENTPTLTNNLMRSLAKVAFAAGLLLTLADGTDFYEANETLVIFVMGQAAAFLGIVTTRNALEHRDISKVEAVKAATKVQVGE